MLLSTPYYNTLLESHVLGCDDEPDFNYGPYELFCLNTRLYPKVYEVYDRDIEIILVDVHKNNRMWTKARLDRITDATFNDPIPNTQLKYCKDKHIILQNYLDTIITTNSKYCLVDRKELYIISRKRYPKGWFNEILGYINLPTEYNPFIQPEGIYLSFNPKSNYKKAYNEVVKLILDTIEQYYKEGVVYGAEHIAENWGLERLDIEVYKPKIFKPIWKDSRFAKDITRFLIDRVNGEQHIKIKVSDNLVKRHHIASVLSQNKIEMGFEGSYIKIPVNNLEDAQYISSLVVSSQAIKGSEKVITFKVNKLSTIYKYINAANNLLDNPDCTGYQTDDIEKPFTFSCTVDMNYSILAISNKLNEMVYTDDRIESKKTENADIG